jgi:hypothetical protein
MENASSKIPWEDLRYIFGQIMYGGHIVNDFDRLLCGSYLNHFLKYVWVVRVCCCWVFSPAPVVVVVGW